MTSLQLRRRVIGGLGIGLAALVGYRLLHPVPGSEAGIAVVVTATLLLAGIVRGALRVDPHQRDLEQKKSYLLTYRSVLATTAVTGIVMLAGLVFAGVVMDAVMAAAQYESLSYAILADVLDRLTALMALPSLKLAVLYIGSVIAAGTGFWLLYPFVPGEDEERLGPVIFVIVWLELGGIALMLSPGLMPEPAAIALDAALVALWGHFFALAYEDVQAYVP